MNRLKLEVSLSMTDHFEAMEDTYRDEGLTVGQNHMRFQGEDIQMEVKYEDLEMGHKIGQGAFSSVKLATNKHNGELYAVKLFNVYDKIQASQLLKEIKMLTSVDCDALISLKGAFHNEGVIGVIIEYMDRGSLDFILKKSIVLTEPVFASIIFQIVWGLGYLHFDNRIHRDIKPANALMNSIGQVKLSDFGISKELDSTTAMSTTAVGTFKYMSPERLLGSTYDKSADLWSLAIMMIELWTKKHPFSYCASTPIDLIAELEIFDLNSLSIDINFSTPMKVFVNSILRVNPIERADCNQLLASEWFQQYQLIELDDAHQILRRWLSTYGKSLNQERNSSLGFEDYADAKDSFRSDYDENFEPPFEEKSYKK